MKLDTDPFPMNVNMINFEEKKILVRTSQAESTRGKNVIVSDVPWVRMIKPRSHEPGIWKTNQGHWTKPRVRATSKLLMEKYSQQRRVSVFQRLGVSRGACLLVEEKYTLSEIGTKAVTNMDKRLHTTQGTLQWKGGNIWE
jgi:hypothetical protein